jgi:Zn-dependent peptidase ImmA (M78 family)
MPRERNIVPVKPELIVWARECVRLSQAEAAELLNVPLGTLQAWESGTEGLGITQLRRMATVYKRPLVALLQPTAPPPQPIPEDFRTVEGIGPTLTTETIVAIRDAQRIQMLATELTQDDPSLLSKAELPRAQPTDSPTELGLLERDAVGIDIETQRRWQSANVAYNAWRARIQALGILVLAKPMPRQDCRGFSLYGPAVVPVIVINSREVDQAKIFTLFHEYAHLALNREGICLERDSVSTERWCNLFSSSLLVPPTTLTEMAPRRTMSTSDVASLARRFSVSRHVIAIRLQELGLAPRSLYEEIKREDEERDWARPITEEEFSGRPQEAVRLSEVGVGFASIVLAALERGLIDPGDASEFLDVRPEKLEPLRERVEAALRRYT